MHQAVQVCTASDSSGIFVFNGFTGCSTVLPWALHHFLSRCEKQSAVDFALFQTQTSELTEEQQQDIWHSLINQFILVEK